MLRPDIAFVVEWVLTFKNQSMSEFINRVSFDNGAMKNMFEQQQQQKSDTKHTVSVLKEDQNTQKVK